MDGLSWAAKVNSSETEAEAEAETAAQRKGKKGSNSGEERRE